MRIHHKLANILGYDLIRHKKSHHSLELHLKKIIDHLKTTLVLDIGANKGQFAQKIRTLGFQGEIISFEPIPKEFERLKLLSSKDPKWEVYPYAIGSKNGTLELNITEESTDFTSFLKPNKFSKDYYSKEVSNIRTVPVEIHTLEDFFRTKKIIPEKVFLKTVTQGYDLEVLNGCGSLLQTLQGVLIEVSFQPIYENMPDATTVIKYLDNHGFRASGFFPVSRNKNTLELIEMDGIFIKST